MNASRLSRVSPHNFRAFEQKPFLQGRHGGQEVSCFTRPLNHESQTRQRCRSHWPPLATPVVRGTNPPMLVSKSASHGTSTLHEANPYDLPVSFALFRCKLLLSLCFFSLAASSQRHALSRPLASFVLQDKPVGFWAHNAQSIWM